MSEKYPPTFKLNHGRKTLCGEANSTAFLRWWSTATTWCLNNATENPADYHPITNPGVGRSVNTQSNPHATRMPYYRDSEKQVQHWTKATPDGVELSDNGILWAILSGQSKPSLRWAMDFDWADRLKYSRTPKGPAIVFNHQGWWVPVIGRHYALVGEGAGCSWLVNPEYPFNLKASLDFSADGFVWLGLIIPSEELLKRAIVYTMDDIPYECRPYIRIARYAADFAFWLDENALVHLSDARKARVENVRTADAKIILPNKTTMWTLTGNEMDCSFKMKTYYVTQKVLIKSNRDEGNDESNDEGNGKGKDQNKLEFDDESASGSNSTDSTALYDQVDIQLLAPLLDKKFLPFLPLIANVRQTQHAASVSALKHSNAKDAFADAVHDLSPEDQATLMNFAGLTSDDMTSP